MSLNIGDAAPDFTLPSFTPSEELTQISLSSFKGKNVVLLFFPQAFTGVCTDELCTMTENYDFYNNLDAVVLAISVDGTFVQRAFAQKNGIKIPLLSDYNKQVVRAYDVLRPEFAHGMREVAERAVFVIDKDGFIRYVEVMANPGEMVNFDAIKNAVEGLK